MKTIKLPYYKETVDLHIDEANLKAVVTAKMHEYKAAKGEAELVEDALDNPIGSKTLTELAVGKKNIVIVTSDPYKSRSQQNYTSHSSQKNQRR